MWKLGLGEITEISVPVRFTLTRTNSKGRQWAGEPTCSFLVSNDSRCAVAVEVNIINLKAGDPTDVFLAMRTILFHGTEDFKTITDNKQHNFWILYHRTQQSLQSS